LARKSPGKKEVDVESYRHETDTRKNAVPVGLASYHTSKPKPKKYDYDPHLDPQVFSIDAVALDRLKRALKASVNEDKFELFTGTRSLPFKLGKEKRTAVKVIDHRGNEGMVVRELK
jgi:adenine-specific DNA-methyltransferase